MSCFTPEKTITTEIYCQQLGQLHAEILKKRAALAERIHVIHQHDNAKLHATEIVEEK